MNGEEIPKKIEILFCAGHKKDEIKKISDEQHNKKSLRLKTVQKWI